MTIEEIIRIGNEAHLPPCHLTHPKALARFAALIVVAEREACAATCEEYMEISEINTAMAIAAGNCADMIRARG